MRLFKLPAVFLGFVIPAVAFNSDWTQWRGPGRQGVSSETGLLKEWPKTGPPLLWSIQGLGQGYGTVAIQGDRIYVQGTQGKESVVLCLNRSDGKKIWVRSLGRALEQDRGGGPRGTPTLEGNRLYALSENGDLACINSQDGSVVWFLNILARFKGKKSELAH